MVKIFAHRGYSGHYPENTMLAFEKALECGVDGIELDVQLTKDGEVVIIHDETIDRTTDGKGYVRDFTLEELRKYNASYKFENLGFNRIPTLREYFEIVKEYDVITNVELKTGIFEYLGIEKKVLELIREFHLEEKVIISSFNHFSVLRMKELAPYLKYGFLSEDWIINPGEYTKKHQVQYYHPRFSTLKSETVEELDKNKIGINTWTVNTEEDFKFLQGKNINSIITNYPEKMKKLLLEREK